MSERITAVFVTCLGLCQIAASSEAGLQVKAVGKDRLVLDLSCTRHNGAYHVATDRWQNTSSLVVNEQSLTKLGQSCAEFLVHAVDVEGKQKGIDEELVALLAEQSPSPVTYAGGVTSMVSAETLVAHFLCLQLLLAAYLSVDYC